MNSLKEVYGALTQEDHVKEAQAQASDQYGADFSNVSPELIKQAQDYDHVGRVLAHHVLADLVKEAMDEEMPNASDDEKKKEYEKTMAKAKGEKSDDEDMDEDMDMRKGKGKGMDKDEDEDMYKKKMKMEGEEKKASLRNAILERMGQDPAYVSRLVSKYYPG